MNIARLVWGRVFRMGLVRAVWDDGMSITPWIEKLRPEELTESTRATPFTLNCCAAECGGGPATLCYGTSALDVKLKALKQERLFPLKFWLAVLFCEQRPRGGQGIRVRRSETPVDASRMVAGGPAPAPKPPMSERGGS